MEIPTANLGFRPQRDRIKCRPIQKIATMTDSGKWQYNPFVLSLKLPFPVVGRCRNHLPTFCEVAIVKNS